MENDTKSTNQSLPLNPTHNKHVLKPLDCCATRCPCFVTCIGYIDLAPQSADDSASRCLAISKAERYKGQLVGKQTQQVWIHFSARKP